MNKKLLNSGKFLFFFYVLCIFYLHKVKINGNTYKQVQQNLLTAHQTLLKVTFKPTAGILINLEKI